MAETVSKKRPAVKELMKETARLFGSIDVCNNCRPKIAEFCFEIGYRAKSGQAALKKAIGPVDLCLADNLKVIVVLTSLEQKLSAKGLIKKDDIDIPESVIDD